MKIQNTYSYKKVKLNALKEICLTTRVIVQIRKNNKLEYLEQKMTKWYVKQKIITQESNNSSSRKC